MIRNEKGLIVPLRFSDSQNIIWRRVAPRLDAHDKLWFIVLKARQIYATTFFEALTFVRTIERPNTNSLIIAQDLDSSTAIFNMAKRFYDYLPLPKLKPPKTKELIFPLSGGPSVFKVVSAGTASKGRGTTQTCVHCSEVAFWPHPEVLTGLFQAMPGLGDTLWVLESTANGLSGQGEMFYRQWKSAIDRKSSLIPIFIPWFTMPKYREAPAVDESEWDEEEKLLVEQFGKYGLDGRSLAWRRSAIETKCQGLIEMFHQEYPSTPDEAFISSGLPAFDPLAILRQQSNICEPLMRLDYDGSADEFVPDHNGDLAVWVRPQEGHQYAIGVDTSEGIKGGDYTCAQVIDMDTLDQVAVLHGSIGPWDASRAIANLGQWYNKAIVNIEVKGSGIAVQDYMLRVLNYPRFHPWRGRADKVSPGPVRAWGWDTNIATRPLLIEAGRRAINKALIDIHDEATLHEIRLFSRNDDGKYEAEAGHDDRVLALLLALRTREENYTGARASIYSIAMSEPDLRGIRVVDAADPERLQLRKVHRELKKAARNSVTDWMNL